MGRGKPAGIQPPVTREAAGVGVDRRYKPRLSVMFLLRFWSRKTRGRREHTGSHVGMGHSWEFHTERRGTKAEGGIVDVSWCELNFFFYLTHPPSNLGSEIKLIKLIKLANICLICYLLQGLVSALIQQTLSTCVSDSVLHVWDSAVNKWTV